MFGRLKRRRPVVEEECPWPTMTDGQCDDPDAPVEYAPNGMRILDRQHIAPIHMEPGDTLRCNYEQTWRRYGEVVQRRQHTLATYTVEHSQTIDAVIILELDDGSLRALGLEYGLAGIFGRALPE